MTVRRSCIHPGVAIKGPPTPSTVLANQSFSHKASFSRETLSETSEQHDRTTLCRQIFVVKRKRQALIFVYLLEPKGVFGVSRFQKDRPLEVELAGEG